MRTSRSRRSSSTVRQEQETNGYARGQQSAGHLPFHTATPSGIHHLQRTIGNQAVARLFHSSVSPSIQRRHNNPDPAPSKSDNPDFDGVTLSEHHVVPYSKLDAFLGAYKKKKKDASFATFSGFIPADDSMTTEQLMAVNVISKEAGEVLKAADLTPQEWLEADEEKQTEALKVVTDQSGAGNDEAYRKRAKASLDTWDKVLAATRSGEEDADTASEPSWGLIMSYATWAKGNLFVGPEGAVRVWDPKDKFDTWAEHFLEAEHYQLLVSINRDIEAATVAVATNPNDAKVTSVVNNMKTLAETYNEPTPFDPSKWTKDEAEQKWKPTAL
ncbi:MAG: hypothetical protein K0Q59_4211 [Paenibacillus sp.]|jgi:hypothetical protein|nr:hypothetical protein [Paenibacillus sp.]